MYLEETYLMHLASAQCLHGLQAEKIAKIHEIIYAFKIDSWYE